MKCQGIEMNPKAINHQPQAINQQKEKRTTKSQLRIVTLSLLAILCLAAAILPASAQQWQCPGTYILDSNPNGWQGGFTWYDNNAVQIGGPAGPPWPALGQPPWPPLGKPNAGVSFGVSQPFTLSSAATVSCLEFLVWEYPELLSSGDISTLYWSLDSTAFGTGSGNTHYGGGTAHTGAQLQQQQNSTCPTNEYGYAVCVVSITLPPGGLKLSGGSYPYYLTLTLGTTVSGDPIYWDQYLLCCGALERPPTGPAGTMTFAIY